MIDSPTAYGEDGGPVPTVGFDYDSADQHSDWKPESDLSEYSQEDIDRGVKVFTTLLSWIWQGGMQNPQGIMIRAIIACWVFLKPLRPLAESDLARGFGMKKQSIGRWVVHFKRSFPRIKLAHFR